MRAALTALFLLSGPAVADDLQPAVSLKDSLVDFDMLFQKNPDKVVEIGTADGNTIVFLNLGDGVSLRCESGRCVGIDKTLATGCLWNIATNLRAYAEFCAVPVDQRTEALLDFQSRISAHVAANALPPRSAEEMERDYLFRVERLRPPSELTCKWNASPDSHWMGLLDDVLSLSPDELDDLLSEPRLPMTVPCP